MESVKDNVLFIISAPFQVLVAKKVCAVLKASINPAFLFIDFSGNLRSDSAYLDSIRGLGKLHFLSLRPGVRKAFDLFHARRKALELSQFADRILLSNPRSLFLRHILKLSKHACFSSFDDGFWNIARTGPFWDSEKKTALEMIVEGLRIAPGFDDILVRSDVHYSIYRLENAMGRSTPIEYLGGLFDEEVKTESEELLSTKTIYLGNMLVEEGRISSEDYAAHLSKVQDEFKISEVLVHPRGSARKYESLNLRTLTPPTLAEEYVLNLRKTALVTVVSSYSTALVNLVNVPGVRVVHVPVPDCGYAPIAERVMRDAGVEVYERV